MCRSRTSHRLYRSRVHGNRELDLNGKFTLQLPATLLNKDGTGLIRKCYAQLYSTSKKAQCPTEKNNREMFRLVLTSKFKSVHVFGIPTGKFNFSRNVCEVLNWQKPILGFTRRITPHPIYVTRPAAPIYAYAPPVAPIYIPPAAPAYVEPSPIYTYAPPVAPIYMPPAAPIYMPPAAPNPIYTPPAAPIYTPPAAPIYTPPAAPIYTPPAAPIYTPQNPIYTPPVDPVYTTMPGIRIPSAPIYMPPAAPVYMPPANPIYMAPENPVYSRMPGIGFPFFRRFRRRLPFPSQNSKQKTDGSSTKDDMAIRH